MSGDLERLRIDHPDILAQRRLDVDVFVPGLCLRAGVGGPGGCESEHCRNKSEQNLLYGHRRLMEKASHLRFHLVLNLRMRRYMARRVGIRPVAVKARQRCTTFTIFSWVWFPISAHPRGT